MMRYFFPRRAFVCGVAIAFLSLATLSTATVSAEVSPTVQPKKTKTKKKKKKTNVIVIMADDIGYECYGCYGSKQYKTPNIDALAAGGVRFTHCHSQPVCTPSRVKIMTGLSNVRNYVSFAILDAKQKTFGHFFQKAGYKTAIAGKWQLHGIRNRNRTNVLKGTGMHPSKSGFDEYCLWQVKGLGSRYWGARIDTNGTEKTYPKTTYGPDVFSDFVCNFIEKNKKEPFFVYYPMALVHDPFPPTPDSKDKKSKDKAKNFEDMVAYMDKIVGKIVSTLEKNHLREETLIIVTGDNGTSTAITSRLGNQLIRGGKGKSIDTGTHVAMVMNMPKSVVAGKVNSDLMHFGDVLPTIVDWAGVADIKTLKTDGVSFAPQLRGQRGTPRESIFCYYNMARRTYQDRRSRWVRNQQWKLYDDGRFYDVTKDLLEKNSIPVAGQSKEAAKIREQFQKEFAKWPKDSPLLFMTEEEKKKAAEKKTTEKKTAEK